jgi:hypothetical protein
VRCQPLSNSNNALHPSLQTTHLVVLPLLGDLFAHASSAMMWAMLSLSISSACSIANASIARS